MNVSMSLKNQQTKKGDNKKRKRETKTYKKYRKQYGKIVFPVPSVTAPKSTGLNFLVKSNLAFFGVRKSVFTKFIAGKG